MICTFPGFRLCESSLSTKAGARREAGMTCYELGVKAWLVQLTNICSTFNRSRAGGVRREGGGRDMEGDSFIRLVYQNKMSLMIILGYTKQKS